MALLVAVAVVFVAGMSCVSSYNGVVALDQGVSAQCRPPGIGAPESWHSTCNLVRST